MIPTVNIVGTLNLWNNQIINLALHNTSSISSPSGGQMYFDTDNNMAYIYSTASGSFYPLITSWAHILPGTSPTGVTYTVGTGSTLSFNTGGHINANLFNGVNPIALVDGGTNNTSYQTGGVVFSNGTSLDSSKYLYFDYTNYRLGIGLNGVPTGSIHIANTVGPFAYITPNAFVANKPHYFEYTGTGLFFTDIFSVRHQFATTGMNLGVFSGTLPISKGGTNATSFTSGYLIWYNGTSLSSLGGLANNEIPVWNGANWASSSGSYVTLVPTSTSRNTITSPSLSNIPLILKGALGQNTYFYITTYNNKDIVSVQPSSFQLNATRIYFDINQGISGNLDLPYIEMDASAPGGQYNSRIEMNSNGGSGPYIKLNGGGSTSNNANGIDLSGGDGTVSYGGTILGRGGAGTAANAGYLSFNGGSATSSSGGGLNLDGGLLAGGHLITYDGGGTLNTNSGFLQLGTVGKRLTIITQPTGRATLFGPQSGTGWLCSSNAIYTSGYAYFVGTGFVTATGFPPYGSATLNDLTDVTTAGKASGDYIRYNGSTYVSTGLPTNIPTTDGTNVFTNHNTFEDGHLRVLCDTMTSLVSIRKANGSTSYSVYFPDAISGTTRYGVIADTYNDPSGYIAVMKASGVIGYVSGINSSHLPSTIAYKDTENYFTGTNYFTWGSFNLYNEAGTEYISVYPENNGISYEAILPKDVIDNINYFVLADNLANSSGLVPRTVSSGVVRYYNDQPHRTRTIQSKFIGPTGSKIASGLYEDHIVAYDGTIQSATVLSLKADSAIFDVQSCKYSSYNAFSSICGGNRPTLPAANKVQDNVLTSWSKAVASGDVIRLMVASGANGSEQASLILTVVLD